MTNLANFIETLVNAPTDKTACFILTNISTRCKFCAFNHDGKCNSVEGIPKIIQGMEVYGGEPITREDICKFGIKTWLETEVD